MVWKKNKEKQQEWLKHNFSFIGADLGEGVVYEVASHPFLLPKQKMKK